MDFPLFEVTSEQYTENKLQYYIEDYNTKSKDVDNRDFYYVLGQETRTKFNYHVKDRYLVVSTRYMLRCLEGKRSLFHVCCAIDCTFIRGRCVCATKSVVLLHGND